MLKCDIHEYIVNKILMSCSYSLNLSQAELDMFQALKMMFCKKLKPQVNQHFCHTT